MSTSVVVTEDGVDTTLTITETAPVSVGVSVASGPAGASGADGADGISILGRNTQTGTSYTLVLDDLEKLVTMDNASANTLTVPPNSSVAFAVNAQVLVAQLGAGQTTIVAGSGVTLRGTLTIASQYEAVSLIQIATDEWLVLGGG